MELNVVLYDTIWCNTIWHNTTLLSVYTETLLTLFLQYNISIRLSHGKIIVQHDAVIISTLTDLTSSALTLSFWFSQDGYRYQKVASSSPVALRGPDTQRSSCLWHLQGPPGSQLELQMEWLLPECRDRLVVYNSITPTDIHLITSWVSIAELPIYSEILERCSMTYWPCS